MSSSGDIVKLLEMLAKTKISRFLLSYYDSVLKELILKPPNIEPQDTE